MWGEPFPVAGALDDDLAAGVGEAVESAVAKNRVVEDAEPLVHRPVGGDDEAGSPVAIEDEFVEVRRLLGGEPVQPQVTQDEQVRGQEGPEGAVQELSTLAWAVARKKPSAWLKRTVWLKRTAA